MVSYHQFKKSHCTALFFLFSGLRQHHNNDILASFQEIQGRFLLAKAQRERTIRKQELKVVAVVVGRRTEWDGLMEGRRSRSRL